MTKTRIFAILALGGLVAMGASGQTGQSSDTSVYPTTPAAESAFPAADERVYSEDDQIPDSLPDAMLLSGPEPVNDEMVGYFAVTLVEPYDNYGELSMDELSAALSMPAGPEPWDLGEFDRWQESPAQHDNSEPVVIIDEGQAIVGLIDLPAEEGQAPDQFAAAQPQALPAEPAVVPAAPRPVVPNAPLTVNALTSAYGAAGTVYATTAEYSCEPPMYAPTYYSYYYAYPYYCASAATPWWNPHWPLRASYCSYPQWPDYYGLYYSSAYGFPYNSYFGVYAGYPYGGYFGTYYGYPYARYFGTYCGYPYGSYYGSYRHHRYFGSGSSLNFSFGGSSWSIYGQLGLSGHQNWNYRSSHDRDDFLSHLGSRSVARGGVSSSRSFSAGAPVRPWRPSVSHQVAAARNGRSYELSTDRSRLGQRGPVDLNRKGLGTGAGADGAHATVSPRLRSGRALTTGGTSAMAAPVVGRGGSTSSTSPRAMTGAGAQNQLQQRRDAYLDVLRRPNAGPGGAAESLSAGGNRTAFGAGSVSRHPSGPDIAPAVTAHQQEMRDSLLRRLNAMPGGSGAAGAAAGPTRTHSTFGPQVAPQQPALPGNSTPAGPRSLTPRSLTPRDLTPRTLTTPSVTITPTPRTTSTLPTPESRFSRSTWPHNSTAPSTSTPSRSYTPQTFAPSTSTPSRSYTPSTYTPRTFTPSQAAPSTSTPSRSYTPSTYTPRTFAPSQAAPSTPAPSRSYTPSTYAPRTFAPSSPEPSFSRSAPSSSRFSPAPRAPSGPAISAPPTRTYSPAPSRAPSVSQGDRSGSFSSRRAATGETAPSGRRR